MEQYSSYVYLNSSQFPLAAYEKPGQFKVYVTDIGLLTSLYGYETQTGLLKEILTGPANRVHLRRKI